MSRFRLLQAKAEKSLVTISSPADAEKLLAGKTYKIDYEAKEGGKAHHVHLSVDGAAVATGHKLIRFGATGSTLRRIPGQRHQSLSARLTPARF
jgi:hypothetical protein